MLRDAGTALVWLAPAPVVAKVATLQLQPKAGAVLLREVRVAQYLRRAGGPVVAPSAELPQRVHLEEHYALTFWDHHPQVDRKGSVDWAEAARALADVHAALAGCPIELGSFRDRQLEPAGRTLALARGASMVPAAELPFLRAVHAELTSELSDRALFEVPLHGDPRRGNLLGSSDGCAWTGLEVACRGPVEWDLAALPGGGDGVFAGVDTELLGLLCRLRSLIAVVWCWRQMAPSPEREATIRHHMDRLRRSHS